MSIEVIKEQEVNIDKCPKLDEQFSVDKKATFVIGDMHGCTTKLIYFLKRHGFIKDLNDKDYSRLVEIYHMDIDELTEKELSEYRDLISKLEFINTSEIILIGDVLADRGKLDWFTLMVLQQLSRYKVPVQIMLSNHDYDLIDASERFKDSYESPMLGKGLAASMTNMNTLINKKLLNKSDVDTLVESIYKPMLRALSYTLSEDGKGISIYTHAPNSLEVIKELAELLYLPYKDSSAKELASTIDSINREFQLHVKAGTVHRLVDKHETDRAFTSHNCQYEDFTGFPLVSLMWNRRTYKLNRPLKHHGYKVNFIHGHDGGGLIYDNIYNIDNLLGKSKKWHVHDYTAICTLEKPAPQNMLIKEKQLTTPKLNTKDVENVEQALDALKDKKYEFKYRRKSPDARVACDALYGRMSRDFALLIKGMLNKSEFKKSCTEVLPQAHQVLDTHRGGKKLIVNIVSAVVGVIGGWLVNFIFTSGVHFFFHPKTDSQVRVEQLEEAVSAALDSGI